MQNLVVINSKKEAVTSSRTLADKFNKRHKNLLAKIDALKSGDTETFTGLRIKLSHYVDASGKRNKEYLLNRDAYAFFAMGFTGKNANKFKIAYINAVNEMESWIKDRIQASIENKVMQATLKDYRMTQGKETSKFNYINENLLVNWALTGEFKSVDRALLTAEQIQLLNDLQTRNAVLIGAGMTRDNRKESLKVMVELSINSQKSRP